MVSTYKWIIALLLTAGLPLAAAEGAEWQLVEDSSTVRFIGVQEEAVWLATTRCCGWHTSPLGVPTRCKARCYGTLCVHCAAGQPCPCWYSADTWDVRYREKAGAIPIM